MCSTVYKMETNNMYWVGGPEWIAAPDRWKSLSTDFLCSSEILWDLNAKEVNTERIENYEMYCVHLLLGSD